MAEHDLSHPQSCWSALFILIKEVLGTERSENLMYLMGMSSKPYVLRRKGVGGVRYLFCLFGCGLLASLLKVALRPCETNATSQQQPHLECSVTALAAGVEIFLSNFGTASKISALLM